MTKFCHQPLLLFNPYTNQHIDRNNPATHAHSSNRTGKYTPATFVTILTSKLVKLCCFAFKNSDNKKECQ